MKTIVVRSSDESYVFVLLPGDRAISWPKLRAHLVTRRLSLPDPATRSGTRFWRPPYAAPKNLIAVADLCASEPAFTAAMATEGGIPAPRVYRILERLQESVIVRASV